MNSQFGVNNSSMPPLIDLGADLLSELCLFLPSIDVFNLSLTCKLMHRYLSSNDVCHQLYVKEYGNQMPLNIDEYKWQEVFSLRSSRSLNFYTWGSARDGRLGYLLSSIPARNKNTSSRGAFYPTNVENFDSTIINQISSGGFSFQVLTGGSVYCLGYEFCDFYICPPGPSDRDTEPEFDPNSLDSRPPHEDMDFPPILRHKPKESSFVNELFPPPNKRGQRITRISSGRTHILALDDSGNVFTWDSGLSNYKMAVHIALPVQEKVVQISAGWNVSACLSHLSGILYWTSRGNVVSDVDGKQNHSVNVDLKVVPKSRGTTLFSALRDYIVYVDQSGLLQSFYFDGAPNDVNRNVPLTQFNSWLRNLDNESQVKSTYTKITGCFKSFTVFTDQGSVLVGHFNDDQKIFEMEVIAELQNRGFTDVVMGDYHSLALTGDGELYSWGLESQNSGCLGLGDLSKIDNPNIIHEGQNTRVLVPMKVAGPSAKGKWLAITAAGWHSGGLYVPYPN